MNVLWPLAKHYIAGRSVDDAVNVGKELERQGISTTYDILGEGVRTRFQAKNIVKEYCELLDIIKQQKLHSNISIKLTHMGLDIGKGFCIANVARLVDRAKRDKSFVRIDMEGSHYTQMTIDVFKRVVRHHPELGIAIQAALYRSVDDIKELIKMKAQVRLVKGAYKEPSTIAFPKKDAVNEQYMHLMEELLLHGTRPAIATHDEHLIDHAQRFASRHRISKSKFEFQMLFGIREDLQESLKKKGYKVRVYVPFGEQWLPYTVRRLRERKENFLFMVRQVARAEVHRLRR